MNGPHYLIALSDLVPKPDRYGIENCRLCLIFGPAPITHAPTCPILHQTPVEWPSSSRPQEPATHQCRGYSLGAASFAIGPSRDEPVDLPRCADCGHVVRQRGDGTWGCEECP